MNKSKILLADDHELFREGLAKIINSQPDLEVVGQAEDGLEALALATKLQPDLIIMDINMPLSHGIEATQLIHAQFPKIHILILTVYEEEEKLFQAIKAGAQGYMLKTSSTAGLLRGVYGALDGESSMPRKLANRVLAEFSNILRVPGYTANSELPALLTSREQDVLTILATGATNQDIADQLNISLQTVKTHVKNILGKLQAKSRKEAAELGIKQGLVHSKK